MFTSWQTPLLILAVALPWVCSENMRPKSPWHCLGCLSLRPRPQLFSSISKTTVKAYLIFQAEFILKYIQCHLKSTRWSELIHGCWLPFSLKLMVCSAPSTSTGSADGQHSSKHRRILYSGWPTLASESRFAGSAGILSSTVRVSTATTPTGIPPSLIKNEPHKSLMCVNITASHLFSNPTSKHWGKN